MSGEDLLDCCPQSAPLMFACTSCAARTKNLAQCVPLNMTCIYEHILPTQSSYSKNFSYYHLRNINYVPLHKFLDVPGGFLS